MIISSVLPPWPGREVAGLCGVWDDERWIAGPYPCLGKADNQGAAAKGNPTRVPALPWGDHPTGLYDIVEVVPMPPEQAHSYGGWFFRLKAVAGDCCGADQQPGTKDDRPGLAIHGGAAGGPYSHKLRPTFGCLRLQDDHVAELARFVVTNAIRRYVCEEIAGTDKKEV